MRFDVLVGCMVRSAGPEEDVLGIDHLRSIQSADDHQLIRCDCREYGIHHGRGSVHHLSHEY
jgi:hypothetical protein